MTMTNTSTRTDPKLIDGRALARSIEQDASERARGLRDQGITPRLAIVYRGVHPDAVSYRKTILQRATRVGLEVQEVPLDAGCQAPALIETLGMLNQDNAVHGVLVQTPLPIEQRRLVAHHLMAEKDVEGFTEINLGRLVLDEALVLPCTPAAIIALIDSRVESLVGKHVVVVNRSPTIGRPLSQMLLSRRATVTVCSSATVDLASETRRADVLVVAIGRARAIGAAYVRTGSVVIDVGINADPQGSGVCGDVDLPAVIDRVAAITPVPGGVGPVTTAMLVTNTLALAQVLLGAS
jgi:methylenetetrahydrofolate dehydrogenase (NADP+)/methenyltetrahydrofolate cyclohydrolase